MSRALFAVFVTGVLGASTSLVTGASGCGSFGATDATDATDATSATASDGGDAGDAGLEPARLRRVVVAPDWPALPALDPHTDTRLGATVVTVSDAADPSRTVERSFAATDRGPYEFRDFLSSNVVDVTIELREPSARVLGYGERRRWDLSASDTVSVAARKRLLYFTSGDRGDGQLRMMDLAPAGKGEPAMAELDQPALPSLASPSGLYVTTDGLLLVQSGRARGADGGAGDGQVSAFKTGTHELARTVALGFPLSAVLPLGDGHRLLGAPDGSAQMTTFAVVDLDSAAITQLPTGLLGGAISIAAMATSPDGAHVAAVGAYAGGANDVPYLFTYDVGAGAVNNKPLGALVDVARGVRFMPDGKTLVVAGAKNDATWATGSLLLFDVTSGPLAQPKSVIVLAAGVTRPSSLVIDPAGKYAHVGNEPRYYGTNQSCCGEPRIIDLTTGQEAAVFMFGASGPEFELTEAIRVPYGARRVIAGQSDNGNNVHGPFVELVPNSPAPVTISTTSSSDIGSIDGLATPFGSRL